MLSNDPSVSQSVFTRTGKILYGYQEFLDPGPKSNNLMDRFLYSLHFDPVLKHHLLTTTIRGDSYWLHLAIVDFWHGSIQIVFKMDVLCQDIKH